MAFNLPRVSIGLPVYNGERYLELALDSLLRQTFGDFELVISDNASTDATEEICRRYAARDSRIRYCRSETNYGAAWNFNRVFTLSRGEFFKWAAYDDLCAPTFLELAVEVLEDNPDVAWCHSQSIHIDEQGEPAAGYPDISYRVGAADKPGRESPRPAERFASILLGSRGCIDIFGLMRSSAMRQTPLHLPYYGSDKVFIAALSLQGAFREIPRPLFFVRVHGDGSGSLATAVQQQQFVNPLARRQTWTRLALLRGYVRAVWRSPLSPREKLRCFAVIGRYLLQIKKWSTVLRKTLTGMGTGGGYLKSKIVTPGAARATARKHRPIRQPSDPGARDQLQNDPVQLL